MTPEFSKLHLSLTLSLYQNFGSLCSTGELVVSAMETFLRLYMDSVEVQNLFPELEKYRWLTRLKPRSKHWAHLARFDLIRADNGTYQVLEINCGSSVYLTPRLFDRIYEELNIRT